MVLCSSVIQIPGESTLRRNFQQIQEGEGRRTPNPLSSRRVAPPPNEPARRDYNHGGPRGDRSRAVDDHVVRPHDDRRHGNDRQAHGRDDRGVRHRGEVRQSGDAFQRHADHAAAPHQQRELHRRPVPSSNLNGQPVRPSPPRADSDSRSVFGFMGDVCCVFWDVIPGEISCSRRVTADHQEWHSLIVCNMFYGISNLYTCSYNRIARHWSKIANFLYPICI